MNRALFVYNCKRSYKTLAIVAAVLTLYITMIVTMYNPEMSKMLDGLIETMPSIMSAVGMTAGVSTLVGFLANYLYGFLLVLFPLLIAILLCNNLIIRPVDRTSMATLLAGPVRRRTIAMTQLISILLATFVLMTYSTLLGMASSAVSFPGQLDIGAFLWINFGAFALQLFLIGLIFLLSNLFAGSSYALGVSAGIPILLYVFQMMANMGGKLDFFRYLTPYTFFDPMALANGEVSARSGLFVLLLGGILLGALGVRIFTRKNLSV